MAEWHSFVAEEREKELAQIIQDEKLKEPETRKVLEKRIPRRRGLKLPARTLTN